MAITLIVGLGNPGTRYIGTRHNAGFWLVEQLVAQVGEQFRAESKFFGEICRVETANFKYWLLKPTTFMNRSGQAVAALANYYKIPVEEILVVHDELDFPVGTIRLKQGGGDCKHNGLKDIISRLGNNAFLRLRIGIGHPGRSSEVAHYVLDFPSREEQVTIQSTLDVALKIMPLIIAGDIEKAMQQLHTPVA